MYKRVDNFKSWGDIFIIADYICEFYSEERYDEIMNDQNAILGGISMDAWDNCDEIIEAVKAMITCGAPAIMVDFHKVIEAGVSALFDVVPILAELLTEAGYTNLNSYEYRLAFGKSMDGN